MTRPSSRPPLLPLLLLLGTVLAAPPAGAADAAADTLPPVPTIGVDEVTRGMTGYGFTVFSGRQPERFEAEVVGVMRNVTPGTSYILARLTGHGLEESGVAGGMSGSPVYFDGRLAGAVAFAWPFSREAIAGITPIALMRRLTEAGGGVPAGATELAPAPPPPVPLADLLAGRIPQPEELLERELARLVPRLAAGAVPGVQWASSGLGGAADALLGRALGSVVPMGRAAAGGDGAPGELVHGGAVAAVLVDGDQRLAATGTVTDLMGDRVLAFGHPFLGIGPLRIPMATAEVVTVLASDYSSFKISNMGGIVGAFEQDRQAGIQGRLGAEAPMLPVTVRVNDSHSFEMQVADLPQITPALIAVTTLGGLTSATYAGGLQGVDLVARFHLADHGELELRQSFDGASAAISSAAYLLSFAAYLMGNDLEEVRVERVEVDLAQAGQPRTASLVGAHAERTVVRPGDRVTLNLDFSAWRGEDFRRRVEVELPHDLPEGPYYLFVGDGASADAARVMVERANPVTFRQALKLLRSLHSRRQLVVLGMAAGRGLSVAGEAMPNLPGTVRSIWSAAGSGSATPLNLAVAQQHVEPMDQPLSGLLRVDLRVERREPLRQGDDASGEGAGEDAAPDAPGASVEGGAEPETAAAADAAETPTR